MKKLENEVKTTQMLITETFLVLFVFLSFLLGMTFYIYYEINTKYTDELSLMRDIHSLRAEMTEFSKEQINVGYMEIKEVILFFKIVI